MLNRATGAVRRARFSRVISRASAGIRYVSTTNCRARAGCHRHGHLAVGWNLLERSGYRRGRGTADSRDQRTQGHCVTADPRSRHADRRDHPGADADSAEGVGSHREAGVLRARTLSILGVTSRVWLSRSQYTASDQGPSKTCDSSQRAQTMRSGMRTSAAPVARGQADGEPAGTRPQRRQTKHVVH
jgi:hypothetical protein